MCEDNFISLYIKTIIVKERGMWGAVKVDSCSCVIW